MDNDFAPVWGVRADISALASGDQVPPDAWPINIADGIGGGGVHLDDPIQPHAEAVNGPELSIAISHELLTMLADPWGNRFTPVADLDPSSDGHQVFYLVEVAGPCTVFSYDIGGVRVSDFILPSFYNRNATGPVDFLSALAGPLPQAAPQGCYISWIDTQDGNWHQQEPDGTFVSAPVYASPIFRADRNSQLGKHDIAAIYRQWTRED